MNDQQLSQLTGIPIEQIATYNNALRLLLIKMAWSKLPKLKSMEDSRVELRQRKHVFDKNAGKARNDYSNINSFEEAFAKGRTNKEKNFFWKKTKANPSGMFSTELKQETQVSIPEIVNQDPVNKLNNSLPTFIKPYTFNKELAIQQDWKEKGLSIPIIQNPKAPMPFLKKAFLQGGTMQQNDIQQQVVQLVQAAASGDQQATQQIEQIMQAAQLGDQQAVQIAQIIQKVIETMKQQKGIKAALGAKLDYINKLKGNCPEGEELVYMKEGGRVCPVCQKKAEKAENGKKLPKKNAVSDFKEKRKLINPNDTVNTKFGPRDLNGKTNYKKYDARKENYDFNTRMRVLEKDEKSGKKVIGSACGSKMKKK